jgi:hypothetical protein
LPLAAVSNIIPLLFTLLTNGWSSGAVLAGMGEQLFSVQLAKLFPYAQTASILISGGMKNLFHLNARHVFWRRTRREFMYVTLYIFYQ